MTSVSSTGPAGGDRGGPAPWRTRFDSARATILAARPSPMIESQVGAVERSLNEAETDRQALHQAIAGIDPARVGAELKTALRSGDGNDHLIASLRRRHETVSDLLNRLERLDQQVDATVADLETLAARTVAGGLRSDGDGARRELDQLHDDVEALAQAHRELEAL